jgi:hypothetical protein
MRSDLIEDLRLAAQQIGAAGINGWGNLCAEAADALEEAGAIRRYHAAMKCADARCVLERAHVGACQSQAQATQARSAEPNAKQAKRRRYLARRSERRATGAPIS